MRVTCESCGAQYNLPDEKVRGRRAKVRCKKCSASIVVDGTSGGDAAGEESGFEDDEATQVMQSPLGALGGASGDVDPDSWTVNLSDDDQRQLSTDEIVRMWLAGEVPEDAFLWQDGMSDWLGVMEVPRIAERIKAASPKVTPARAPAPALGASSLGVSPKGATPKPGLSAAKKDSPNPAATRQARPPTFDLFGPPRSLQRDSVPHQTSAPKHAPPGASNENSVLFSLDALKAAAGQQETRAPDSRVSEDILTLGGFDAMGSPLSAPLIEVIPTAPVVTAPAVQAAAPVTQTTLPVQEKKTPVWMWGAGAAAVLLVGFFGVRTMLAPAPASDVRTATTTEPSADPAAVAAEEEAAKKKAEEEEAAKKKAEEEEAAKKKAEEEEAAKKKAQEEAQAKLGSGSSGSGSSGSSSGSSGTNTGSSSGSSGATKGGSESGGSSAAAGPFNVGAAKSALSAAAGKAKLCKKPDGPTGSGKVQVTFAPSGRVTSAVVVAGPFGGSAVGGCVARAFRSARVPAFSGSATTVAKSFSIN